MDERLIEEFTADKRALIEDVNVAVDLAYEALEQLWKIISFKNNGTTSALMEFFRFCSGTTSPVESSVTVIPFASSSSTDPQLEETGTAYQLPLNTGSISVEPEDDLYPWLNVTRLDQCDDAYRKFKKHFDDVTFVPFAHTQQNDEFFTFAEDFAVTIGNPYLYRKCLGLIQEGRNITGIFTEVYILIDDVVHGPEDLMEHLLFLHEKFNSQKYSKEFDTRLKQTCGWRNDFSDTLREKVQKEKYKIMKGREAIFDIWRLNWRLDKNLFVFQHSFVTESMSQYLGKNMTKQELAKQFLSAQNLTKRENFFQRIINSEDFLIDYQTQFKKMIDPMLQGYGNLREQRPVIINDSSAQRLELVRKALTVDNLTDLAREGDVIGIIDQIRSVFSGLLWRVQGNVIRPLPEIRNILKMVETNLREYQASIKMDSQFYL